jgi:phytoene dehydrogenase-like protein
MTSKAQWDAIVIGGGHNGLVCAAYLAKAGRRVLVLERRHVLGGAAVTEELYPGFHFSVYSYVVSLLRPKIIRELELARHGLEILPLDTTFLPLPDGRSLARWSDAGRTYDEIRRFSAVDADQYSEFGLAMCRMSQFVGPILEMTPPSPTSRNPLELMELLKLGKRFANLAPADRHGLVRLMTGSAVDVLDQWFESEPLKATMSASGIIGTFLGVRSPGTAYVLLHHYMGQIDGAYRAWGFAKGGTGGISLSIARSAESFGAEIRTNARVQKILVEGNQTTGVVLENGDELSAKTVISSVDPHLTFLRLVGTGHFDDEFVSSVRRFKMRGSSGKVNLALDRIPEFTCRPGVEHLRGDVNIAPSYDYLERAYDEAKYGAFSRRPFMNIVYPTLTDSSLAPPGKHIMSCFVQYAPYHLKEGPEDWPNQRDAFGEAVIDTLEEYCPDIRDCILYQQTLTPWDLEKEIGLTEGNIFHGELGLEQLFFLRPAAKWARYKTPIQHLWICGSGAHPGGGIMGSPGSNAARDLLRSGEVS